MDSLKARRRAAASALAATITRKDTMARKRQQKEAKTKARAFRKKEPIMKGTSPVAVVETESEPTAARQVTTPEQRTRRWNSNHRLLNKLSGSSKNGVSKDTTKRKK
jgi:hypothetical protein